MKAKKVELENLAELRERLPLSTLRFMKPSAIDEPPSAAAIFRYGDEEAFRAQCALWHLDSHYHRNNRELLVTDRDYFLGLCYFCTKYHAALSFHILRATTQHLNHPVATAHQFDKFRICEIYEAGVVSGSECGAVLLRRECEVVLSADRRWQAARKPRRPLV